MKDNSFSKEEFKMPEEQFGGLAEQEQPSHIGIILGVLILVLMLILGGLYLWGRSLQEPAPTPVENDIQRPTDEENNEPESTNAEAEVETMQALSTSDEIELIDADVQGTNVDNLDAENMTIEAELGAQYNATSAQ